MRHMLRRLRAEDGQTLIFFVMSMVALAIFLAFIVDVGALIATKHKVQHQADAEALALAQASVDQEVYGSTTVPTFSSTKTQTAPMIALNDFQATADATATFAPAASATSDANARQTPPPDAYQTPYVVPLMVNECVFGLDSNCTSVGCAQPDPSCSLTLTGDPSTAQLAAVDISCRGGGCAPPPFPRFRQWMTCNPQCFDQTVRVGDTFGAIVGRRTRSYPPNSVTSPAAQIDSSLTAAPGAPSVSLLLPVYAWDATAHLFDVVGISRFAISSVNWASLTITGNFVSYRVGSADTKPGLPNFGVRAIVLAS